VKANNNDFNDPLAIAEAASRATIPSVPLKNMEQLELQDLQDELDSDATQPLNSLHFTEHDPHRI
jgi:hypothetical protein